jgi:hypothetical protein
MAERVLCKVINSNIIILLQLFKYFRTDLRYFNCRPIFEKLYNNIFFYVLKLLLCH